MIKADAIVVDLVGVTPEAAYAWGVEAGAFMQFGPRELIAQHIVYAGNIGMIEMICAERGANLDILRTLPDRYNDNDMLMIVIRPKR